MTSEEHTEGSDPAVTGTSLQKKQSVFLKEADDTHSYRGWLNSDSFLKRAFAVIGYSIVAQLIVWAIATFLLLIISFVTASIIG